MKNLKSKKQQTGFTLIELVVVIVILGILAATAIPQFTDLQDEANQAVANGIAGAVLSSAVIRYGVVQGSSTAVQIEAATISSETFTTSLGACTGANQSFTVTVTDSAAVSDPATMPAGLCSG